ncbi:MAG: hypothetical protein Kow0031_01300 [Anaerolineae bacterium]
MNQRKTQTAEYWKKQFQVSEKDIETVYQLILERNQPVSLDELAIFMVKQHCDAEELANRSELQNGKIYQPKDSYQPGETVIFPALEFASAEVLATREGRHPDYGSFNVISVRFSEGGQVREFASGFTQEHQLNASEQSLANLQGLQSPEQLYGQYRPTIAAKLQQKLADTNDFVRFQDRYYLRDGLPEFHEGLYNIADAAIDINQGPMAADALIEQMGLASGDEIGDILRFSVNYHLANDERFDDVGPTGQVLWYLDRIEPPEAHHPPRRLQAEPQSYDISLLDDDLLDLIAEIDDELTDEEDVAPVDPDAKSVTLVLNYPHWRVGTLPLTAKTLPFFQTSVYNPVLIEFVDGRTGDTFPGWVVNQHGYVFGLDDWYSRNKLPVGAYISLKRTDSPNRVIVDYQATRTQRDWIRMVRAANRRLNFQMNPAAINCKYDDLMLISDAEPAEIDKLWVTAQERKTSIYQILCDVFPELSKLNPQSTVHAKTLYSAVNVVRRVSPGVVFQELVSHACFIPMNHGYWTFDSNLKD